MTPMDSSSRVVVNGSIVSLLLAVGLVAGVIGVGRHLALSDAQAPVALSIIDAPEASSPQCAELLERLPSKVGGFRSVDLVDPAPEGAAAWAKSSQQRVTLRCGVDAPAQFSDLSVVDDGWMRVGDETPGSTLSTWYRVGSTPVVAVTADQDADSAVTELIEQVGAGDGPAAKPHPIALSTLASSGGASSGEGAEVVSRQCRGLMAALPQVDGYQLRVLDASEVGPGVADGTMAAWVAEGREPVVVRCGVALPQAYEPGAALQQVNDVAWLEDSTLGNGTTASTLYGLGYEQIVAVNLPQALGTEVLTPLSNAIAKNLPEQPQP